MLSVWAQAGPILGVCECVCKVKRAKARQAWVVLAASSVGSSQGTAWGGAALCESVKPGT